MLQGASTVTVNVGAPEFDRGNWNANTNSPTLGDNGVGGTVGDFYTVSVAGATSIDGETDWKVGDIIKCVDAVAGKHWQKIDQTNEAIEADVISTVLAVPASNWLSLTSGTLAATNGGQTALGQNVHTGIVLNALYQLQWSIEMCALASPNAHQSAA